MTEPVEMTRKRLAMRSMRRGIKEMDLILTDFAARHLSAYDAAALAAYEALLEESDLDIYSWISGLTLPPQRFSGLIADIATGATGLTRPRGA